MIPRHLGTLNAQLANGGSDWLAGTAKPSIADFFWGAWLKFVIEQKWFGEADVLGGTPELKSWFQRFYEIPAIVSYYEQSK